MELYIILMCLSGVFFSWVRNGSDKGMPYRIVVFAALIWPVSWGCILGLAWGRSVS